MRTDVAIVGAGWAGLSAAVRLAQAGRHVHLIESAPEAGGRAREARLDLGATPVAIDAGQHLLVGAYRESLALAQLLNDDRAPIDRFRLRLSDTAGLRLEAAPLPAPLHLAAALLLARGLPVVERLALARMFARLRAAGWRAPAGQTVTQWLAAPAQPPALVDRLWEPLCIATLNTPPAIASAQVFATVLRDTLGAARADSDFLLPRATLAAVVSRPACAWLRTRGATLSFGSTVRSIEAAAGHWRLRAGSAHDPAVVEATQVVLAVPPHAAARLVEPLCAAVPALAGRATSLRDFDYEAIATVTLAWPAAAAPRLPRWTMLRASPQPAWHGQWLFDRGRHGTQHIATVVISARDRSADAEPPDALAAGVARQVAAQLRVPPPAAARVVTEKRATFRCTPQRPRFAADAFAPELPGFWLAGEYAWPDYPATLEGAVRSGRAAAERALDFNAGRDRLGPERPRGAARL